MIDRLYEAGLIVGHLTRALVDGTRDLGVVPDLIKRIIEDELWHEYSDPRSGRKYGPFTSFPEFVESPARDGGLGMTRKQLDGLCVENMEVRNLIDEAYERERGYHGHSNHDNIMITPSEQGTSQSYAFRKLRKDRPDLLEQVLSGDLKPNAAMEQAGFRKLIRSVRMDDPDSAARTIRRFMSPEARLHLAQLLQNDA